MLNRSKLQFSTQLFGIAVEVLAIGCLLASVGFAFINVIARVVFDTGFVVIDEVSRYTVLYAALLYFGPLILRDDHIKMDLVATLLKGRWRHLHSLLVSSIVFGSTLILFWTSLNWVNDLMKREVMTGSGLMLMAIPTFCIPLGMFLGAVCALCYILTDLRAMLFRKQTPDLQTAHDKND